MWIRRSGNISDDRLELVWVQQLRFRLHFRHHPRQTPKVSRKSNSLTLLLKPEWKPGYSDLGLRFTLDLSTGFVSQPTLESILINLLLLPNGMWLSAWFGFDMDIPKQCTAENCNKSVRRLQWSTARLPFIPVSFQLRHEGCTTEHF